MKGMVSRPRFAGLLAAVGALVLAASLLLGATPAFAKSYSMGPVNIYAQVAPDGSMSVAEDRTFDFSGSYHFVYWDLLKKGGTDLVVTGLDEVTDSGVRSYRLSTSPSAKTDLVPGTYWLDDSSGKVSVYAFFSKSDQQATFRLKYSVCRGPPMFPLMPR